MRLFREKKLFRRGEKGNKREGEILDKVNIKREREEMKKIQEDIFDVKMERKKLERRLDRVTDREEKGEIIRKLSDLLDKERELKRSFLEKRDLIRKAEEKRAVKKTIKEVEKRTKRTEKLTSLVRGERPGKESKSRQETKEQETKEMEELRKLIEEIGENSGKRER